MIGKSNRSDFCVSHEWKTQLIQRFKDMRTDEFEKEEFSVKAFESNMYGNTKTTSTEVFKQRCAR